MQFVQLGADGTGTERPLVLVVDDDPAVRRPIARYLHRLTRVNVVQARGGTEALELLQTASYAAVVSDVQMPDGDGLALWREATARQPALRGRFVFCTAVASAAARGTGERVLEKPFDLAQVGEAVEDILRPGDSGR